MPQPQLVEVILYQTKIGSAILVILTAKVTKSVLLKQVVDRINIRQGNFEMFRHQSMNLKKTFTGNSQ